jgi:hypothetical protein
MKVERQKKRLKRWWWRQLSERDVRTLNSASRVTRHPKNVPHFNRTLMNFIFLSIFITE